MNLYPYYKQCALDKTSDMVDLDTDTIKLALVESYTYDSTDKYVADVLASGASFVARSSALGSKTVTNGTFDAADVTFTSVTTAHTISSVILYKDTGNDATSVLVAHIDKQQDAVSSISQATSGVDITVTFHGSGIYDL